MVRSTSCCGNAGSVRSPASIARAGDRVLRFFKRTGVEIVQHDGRARRRELLRDGASDTPARAGDQGDFRFQREHELPTSLASAGSRRERKQFGSGVLPVSGTMGCEKMYI